MDSRVQGANQFCNLAILSNGLIKAAVEGEFRRFWREHDRADVGVIGHLDLLVKLGSFMEITYNHFRNCNSCDTSSPSSKGDVVEVFLMENSMPLQP